MAGDLLLAVGEDEAGQVADVLAADAEVGVDAVLPRTAPGAARGGRDAPRRRPRPSGARSAAVGGAAKSAGVGRPGADAHSAVAVLARGSPRAPPCVLAKAWPSRAVVLGDEVHVAVLRVGRERGVDRRRASACDRARRGARRSGRCCSPASSGGSATSRQRDVLGRRPEGVLLPLRRSRSLLELDRVDRVDDRRVGAEEQASGR